MGWNGSRVSSFNVNCTKKGHSKAARIRGATLAVPVDRLNSIKFHASSGVSARIGNNYDGIGVAWQHRWGGGL